MAMTMATIVSYPQINPDPMRYETVWNSLPHQLVPWRLTRPLALAPNPVPPPLDCSEEQLDRYQRAVRLAQQTPPWVPCYPANAWAIDEYGDLYQLRRFAISSLIWAETKPTAPDRDLDWLGMLGTVEKYARWLRRGIEPPPLTVQQSNKGNYMVVNGHHRGAALYRAGLSDTLAWTSDALVVRGFTRGLNWNMAVELAIATALPVPLEVRRYARCHFQAEAFVLTNIAAGTLATNLATLERSCAAAVDAYLEEWGWTLMASPTASLGV